MSRKPRILGFVVGLTLALASFAGAQEITATLGGTVKDSDGAAVPGATITVVQDKTGASRTGTSAGGGAFVFNNLQIGTYTVTV